MTCFISGTMSYSIIWMWTASAVTRPWPMALVIRPGRVASPMANTLASEVWPKVTERYDAKKKKIFFNDGSSMDADAVIISIGESPVLDFLPAGMDIERGYLMVDDNGQ